MVLFHSISALVYDCGYPKIIAAGLILHSTIFIVLFTNFYMQAYKKDKPKTTVDSCNNNTNGYVPNGKATINGHMSVNGIKTNGYRNEVPNGFINEINVAEIHEEFVNDTTLANGYTNGHVTMKEKVQ
ncbi:unnamed protein product [Euphydryas editha]|uniref:Elongation of very long chain fatty acids protein n=1 Tax=Euphydryas editha TaxID=104508 RepID=A0AAU9V6P2_EUPED|nr:unnamed protein product [Euphydryas editha]